MKTLAIFVELWLDAARCKKRRRSVWRHPFWVIRFYWGHAREWTARPVIRWGSVEMQCSLLMWRAVLEEARQIKGTLTEQRP